MFIILCCLSSSYSSSSSSGPVNQSNSSRVITHLPGFDGPLPFHLETGYVEVDEGNSVHLFYYFVRSERSPADDAIMLWLTGGPGCSVLTGLAYEIGPLSFDLNDAGELPKLVYRQDSWTKVSSIIFLDSPVGAGFSYSDTEQGYRSSDTKAVNQILIFLRKWFVEHTEFLSNPLYIAGDSYSGMIVPTVASRIARGIEIGSEPSLNLKGYLVGNPVTDSNFDSPSKIPFVHGMGLISDEMFEVLEPLCTFASPHPYKPTVKLNSSVREMLQLQEYTSNAELHLSEISLQCRTAGYLMSRTWANNKSVREALGIHKDKFVTLGRSLYHRKSDNRYVWCRFTRSYSNNLTFTTIKGGGHTAPEYMPRQCFVMFERWISGDAL
ncbi:hypothetical protein PR202_gb07610 [Eleusine coracana subsp. coracana]|uniref:Uncharacterized protein n=1 Tax=Eleusine coracana subsp. coracana TaxID=191504 RepID=A0AAV5EC76_ELECO|nr:hypothetical protein PR202_gb07610 [Eleusine coracana subsp. coracana]